MTTTTTRTTRGTPLTTSRMATPPPSTTLHLHDAGKVTGWVDGMAFGFRGFGSEEEAAHAAWTGYRTMSRRFARESGHRLLPIDSEPLSLGRAGDVDLVIAGVRPIATLLRPGADSRSGPDSFGFELQAPIPTDELTMRSTAHLVYRTLRRSGIRWAMWAPTRRATPADVQLPADARHATAQPARDETRSGARSNDRAPSGRPVIGTLSPQGANRIAAARLRDDSSGILGTLLIVLAVLSVVLLPAITSGAVVPLLGGVAGLIALAALAAIIHLVASDIRDLARARPTKRAPSADAPVPAAARMAA